MIWKNWLSGRRHGSWNSMSPNVTLWEWQGTPPHKQIVHGCTLHNQVLENISSAKYLGVQITDDLEWGQHINEITSKATKTLGFLHRNMAFAPRETTWGCCIKNWSGLNLNMQHLFGCPIIKRKLTEKKKFRGLLLSFFGSGRQLGRGFLPLMTLCK